MGQFLLSLITIGVMIFAIVDIITSQEWQIKFLPKFAWVIIVILLPLIGSILWFVLGKERTVVADSGGVDDPRRAPVTRPDPASRPDPVDIDAAVDAEIEFHEKQAEIRRLEEKLRAKREGPVEG